MTDGYFTGQLGFSGGSRTANLWIEGIQNTAAMNQQIKVSVDPDGAGGPAGFVLSDAVRVFVPLIQILDSASALTDHVDIGHWGADSGSGLTGYDAMNMVINGSGGTFIDSDPDRFKVRVSAFYANANPAVAETLPVKIATTGTVTDDDTTITLLETGVNTGVFDSEFMLMMSPDLPTADNPDDDYAVYSVRASTTVADDATNDRTHRTDIDGHLRVTYDAPGGSQTHSVPVCDRYPTEERKTLTIRVHVFLEPFSDTGYDHDSNPSTPPIGGGNGVFDFNDSHSNGQHDSGEASESFTDITMDGTRNTVLGSTAVAAAFVDSQISRANIAWAQACINVVQSGTVLYDNPPVDTFGTSVFADFEFDDGPGNDEEFIIESTSGAVHNVADVFFVPASDPFPSPFTGLASTPGLRGGVVLPSGLLENTYLFVCAGVDIRRRTLAHEIGHALTNRPDISTPPYIYFPSFDPATFDNAVNQYRRIQRMGLESDALKCRTAGPPYTGVGNRLLPGCP